MNFPCDVYYDYCYTYIATVYLYIYIAVFNYFFQRLTSHVLSLIMVRKKPSYVTDAGNYDLFKAFGKDGVKRLVEARCCPRIVTRAHLDSNNCIASRRQFFRAKKHLDILIREEEEKNKKKLKEKKRKEKIERKSRRRRKALTDSSSSSSSVDNAECDEITPIPAVDSSRSIGSPSSGTDVYSTHNESPAQVETSDPANLELHQSVTESNLDVTTSKLATSHSDVSVAPHDTVTQPSTSVPAAREPPTSFATPQSPTQSSDSDGVPAGFIFNRYVGSLEHQLNNTGKSLPADAAVARQQSNDSDNGQSSSVHSSSSNKQLKPSEIVKKKIIASLAERR